MNFELGDKVICINDHSHQSVIKGRIYTVQGFHTCSNCQAAVIDVGLQLSRPVKRHFCSKCKGWGTTYNPDSNIHYAFASRFVKLDDLMADCWWSKKEKTMDQQLKELFENEGNNEYYRKEILKRKIENN